MYYSGVGEVTDTTAFAERTSICSAQDRKQELPHFQSKDGHTMTSLRPTVDSFHFSQVLETGRMISPPPPPQDRIFANELGLASAWLALTRIFPERHYEPVVPDISGQLNCSGN